MLRAVFKWLTEKPMQVEQNEVASNNVLMSPLSAASQSEPLTVKQSEHTELYSFLKAQRSGWSQNFDEMIGGDGCGQAFGMLRCLRAITEDVDGRFPPDEILLERTIEAFGKTDDRAAASVLQRAKEIAGRSMSHATQVASITGPTGMG